MEHTETSYNTDVVRRCVTGRSVQTLRGMIFPIALPPEARVSVFATQDRISGAYEGLSTRRSTRQTGSDQTEPDVMGASRLSRGRCSFALSIRRLLHYCLCLNREWECITCYALLLVSTLLSALEIVRGETSSPLTLQNTGLLDDRKKRFLKLGMPKNSFNVLRGHKDNE